MGQVNFYVSTEVEQRIRKEARKRKKSISSFLAELVKSHFPEKKWDKLFFNEIVGGWCGDFPEISRPLSQEREDL